ncbi:MAG TPA: shikimate dehydrogenase [Gemmatimonadales bacterium]|nr:shikimate dehydrogenase [Gemmatimonadales bacterium]
MEIRASTRLLAVLGDPVGHSLSPVLFNAAIAALGLDAVYVALRVADPQLAAVLAALARTGGAGNVTVPHKEAVERSLARKTDLCARTGACNTFWTEQGGLVGDNTDVAGVREGLAALDAAGATRWLVLGTGGTARAVAVAAAEAGAELLVRSRDPGRGTAFADWATSAGTTARAARDGERVDVVVNATPAGLRRGDPLPTEPRAVPGVAVALDMVYAPGETRWVRVMREAGCRAADGRVPLVAQAVAAFARFFPDVRAPREVMRAAVDRALRD